MQMFISERTRLFLFDFPLQEDIADKYPSLLELHKSSLTIFIDITNGMILHEEHGVHNIDVQRWLTTDLRKQQHHQSVESCGLQS